MRRCLWERIRDWRVRFVAVVSGAGVEDVGDGEEDDDGEGEEGVGEHERTGEEVRR